MPMWTVPIDDAALGLVLALCPMMLLLRLFSRSTLPCCKTVVLPNLLRLRQMGIPPVSLDFCLPFYDKIDAPTANMSLSTPAEEPQPSAKEDSPVPAPAPRRRLLKRSKVNAEGESEAGETSTSATPVPTPPPQPVIPSLLDLDAPAPPPRRVRTCSFRSIICVYLRYA